jgi:hypothetical protein
VDKPVDVSALSSLWSILVSLIVALVALGGFRAKVATKGDLEKSEKDMLKRLYDKDGITIFQPRAECEKNQASCSRAICSKLDEMRADTQRRHEEDLAAQREHLRLHGDLAEFVGAVKQFMQHHNKEG